MYLFDFKSPLALLDTAGMRAADHMAIKAGVSGERLMEEAGRAVAEEALRAFRPDDALILAGPGNNGGDGWVAARHLAEAGVRVRVAATVGKEALGGDAAVMSGRYDGACVPFDSGAIPGAGLIIDALFGSGLARPLEPAVRAVSDAVARAGVPVLAVDIPSGVGGDDGSVSPGAIRADLTVTFFRKKPGHLLMPGRLMCGRIIVRDIGIPESVLDSLRPHVFENDPALWAPLMSPHDPMGHKYHRGHALIAGGRPPCLGAARLAARAALRAGAGLVTLATPEEAYAIQAAAAPDEVMVRPFSSEEDFEALLGTRRISALLLGPGGGADAAMRKQVLAALRHGMKAVLDADALNAFAGPTAQLLFDAIASDVALTPHEGEFVRLFGEDMLASKLDRASAAAHRSGAVLLLKGPDSVIAAPTGEAVIEAGGPPHLATAGSGDVLAGILLAMMARGMPALAAAAAAAGLHAMAARLHGEGMIASDITESLPRIFASLTDHQMLSFGRKVL
ncbi:MAG: bifunctional ADP-dependent NAD(P)H-hydrate dehydratase/NAD(P)H-hydrate epimerase [Rhodothalassiaceae bacterium]